MGRLPSRMRQRVLAAHGYRCCLCPIRFFLDVHHIEAKAEGGNDTLENLTALCPTCHRQVHSGAISKSTLLKARVAHLEHVELLMRRQDFLSLLQSALVAHFIHGHCVEEEWDRTEYTRLPKNEVYVIAFAFPDPGQIRLITHPDGAGLMINQKELGELAALERVTDISRLIYLEEEFAYREGVPERHYLVQVSVIEKAAQLEEALAFVGELPDPDLQALVQEVRSHREAIRSHFRSEWPGDLQGQEWRRMPHGTEGA